MISNFFLICLIDFLYFLANEDTPLKCAICYSKNLEATKEKTIVRQVAKEKASLEKLFKTYVKRAFACEEDADKEILNLTKKDLKKVKYHSVSLTINVIEKQKRGKQSKDISEIENEKEYYLQITLKKDEEKVQKQFEEACTFIL